MTQEHTITPPPELVEQWLENTRSQDCIGAYPANYEQLICTQAARWGADQELEACCQWLEQNCGRWELPAALRAARRLKPPSLKEQAKQALGRFFANEHTQASQMTRDFEIIRRAVESLPD